MSGALEAFIEYISVSKALSIATIKAYVGDLKQFEAFLGFGALGAQTEDVIRFLSGLGNKRTLNRKLSAINAFFDFCLRYEFTEEKPRVRLSKLPKELPIFVDHAQIGRALDSIDKTDWLGIRDYALILFLYATGARISEALAVRREDLEEGWLRIRNAKGEKERLVPVASRALDAINDYLALRPFKSGYIWLNYQGKRLSRVSAYKIVYKYLGVSPHVLRHSYATSLILGGADLRVVQELLGHASINTTQIYTHIQKSTLRKTVLDHHPLSSVRCG